MGEQGVASRSALDAMQYNPANLAFADGIAVSVFRSPSSLWTIDQPLESFNVTVGLGQIGSVGIEYTYRNLGSMTTTTVENPGAENLVYLYERSIAGGYALALSDELAIGAQLRYALYTYFSPTFDGFLFSAGLSYKPAMFSNRLSAGLSFMNFGARIEGQPLLRIADGRTVAFSDSPPSQINLGIEGSPVANDFFDVDLSLGAKKPLDKRRGWRDYEAQSSFKSLFNDWDDFPEDVTGQIGLGFLWHPIYVGSGVSFFQEMYLGFVSTGPKDIYNSFYTHGFKVGLEARGIQATAGYAGRWQNNQAGSYSSWQFPWETFQFTLDTDMSLFRQESEEQLVERSLQGTILSGGYAYGIPVGRMKETAYWGRKSLYLKNHEWSVEADFYVNEHSAILSSFRYARMTNNTVPIYSSLAVSVDFGIETISLESGFRYHPIELFHPFFVQALLGVIRMNPVEAYSSPRYTYKSFDEVAIGCAVPVINGIILMPKIALKTIFMEIIPYGRIGGYNQFQFGMNVGYKL